VNNSAVALTERDWGIAAHAQIPTVALVRAAVASVNHDFHIWFCTSPRLLILTMDRGVYRLAMNPMTFLAY
jgi:hypothetical protein